MRKVRVRSSAAGGPRTARAGKTVTTSMVLTPFAADLLAAKRRETGLSGSDLLELLIRRYLPKLQLLVVAESPTGDAPAVEDERKEA